MCIVRYDGKEFGNVDVAEIHPDMVCLFKGRKPISSFCTYDYRYVTISNGFINVLDCLGMVYVARGSIQIVQANKGYFSEKYKPFEKCSFDTDCQYSDVGTIPKLSAILSRSPSCQTVELSGKFSKVTVSTSVEKLYDLSCVVKSTKPYIGLLKADTVYSMPSPKKCFSGFQMFLND